jgi:hypothetical protein
MLIITQVKNGSTKNWENAPKRNPLGFLIKYLKSSHLKSNATPYIISAKAKLSKKRSPWEKFSRMESSEFSDIGRKSWDLMKNQNLIFLNPYPPNNSELVWKDSTYIHIHSLCFYSNKHVQRYKITFS